MTTWISTGIKEKTQISKIRAKVFSHDLKNDLSMLKFVSTKKKDSRELCLTNRRLRNYLYCQQRHQWEF